MRETFGGALLAFVEEVEEHAVKGTGCGNVANGGIAGAYGGRERVLRFAIWDWIGDVGFAACLMGVAWGWSGHWILYDMRRLSTVEKEAQVQFFA